MIVYLSATMLSCHHLFIFVVFTILYENSSAQLLGRPGFEYDVQNNRQQKSPNNQARDYFAQGDEHHRIIILVPQIPHQETKKPKSHHHHHKVLPVVHSGKVIHAHHHHGKVDHSHAHDAKAKHDHKHHLIGGHKHSHFGVGSHKHKHDGKAAHHHKHDGHAHHKHSHLGKGSVHHLHEKYHHHPKPAHPAPAEPPMKKLTDFLRYGIAGGDENSVEPYVNQIDDVPRVKIDPEILRALSPALINSVYSSPIPGGRIIQIRVPDAHDENLVKEFNIDTQSDVAVLKKDYVGDNGGVSDDYGNGGFEYVGAQEDEGGEETDDKDGEMEYQLGDGYRLAASAAAGRLHGHHPQYNIETIPMHPSRPSHRVITHDGTYQYRYD